MTVTVRSGCPTNTLPIEKNTGHTKVILQRGDNGQLVRKLFQPKEFSTVMQKSRSISATAKDFNTISQTLIRPDTDASRLCAIIKT